MQLLYLIILQAIIAKCIYGMDAKIRLALITLLNEKEKVVSWGISNISFGDDFVAFDVDGLIYKGNVMVKSVSSDYEIYFSATKTLTCSLEDMVDILDVNIEKTQNYRCDLENWFASLEWFPNFFK